MAVVAKETKDTRATDLIDLEKKEAGWLEGKLGTQSYRALRGLVENPVSLAGFVLPGLFVFVAVAAPVLGSIVSSR